MSIQDSLSRLCWPQTASRCLWRGGNASEESPRGDEMACGHHWLNHSLMGVVMLGVSFVQQQVKLTQSLQLPCWTGSFPGSVTEWELHQHVHLSLLCFEQRGNKLFVSEVSAARLRRHHIIGQNSWRESGFLTSCWSVSVFSPLWLNSGETCSDVRSRLQDPRHRGRHLTFGPGRREAPWE